MEDQLQEKLNHLEWEIGRLRAENEKLSHNLALSRISEYTLKANESRLKLLLEYLPLPVFLKDQDSVYMLANRRYMELLNVDFADMEGKTDFDFYPVDLAEKYRSDDARILSEGKAVTYEEDFVENGTVRSVLTTKMPYTDPETGAKCILGVFIDQTDRRNNMHELQSAREKAERSDILKSVLLVNMAQELRSPLNSVSGFAQLLEHPDISEEKRNEYIFLINKRGNDLLNIINDIVDISQLDAGKTGINVTCGDVNDLFTELFNTYSSGNRYDRSRPVELRTGRHLDRGNSFIHADFGKLRQVLTHLLDNAFAFTDKGEIEFGCELTGSRLEFYVRDTGRGIPDDRMASLFDGPQLPDTDFLCDRYEGAGLGMALCRRLLELMQGSISATSAIDKGSEFRFHIPYVPAAGNHVMEDAPDQQDDWANHTILVVEDNHFNCEFLAAVLRRTNANFSVAYDGESALKIFRETKSVDVVLMDIRLPDISGFELTQIMKALRPDVKVIAITAYTTEDDRQYAMESGCDSFIPKPVDLNLLLKTIDKQFTRSSATQ